MSRRHYYYSVSVWLLLGVLFVDNAHSDEGILLNCDRLNGEDEFQIYINETKKYVLYNAQLIQDGNYERTREAPAPGGKDGETIVVDFGLDIRINNSNFIIAREDAQDYILDIKTESGKIDVADIKDRVNLETLGGSTFVFVKKTMKYAYAWATLIPVTKNDFLPFSYNHSGECAVNPFDQ
jgi:hypothetical protein